MSDKNVKEATLDNISEVVVSGIPCRGYALVADTSVGCYLVTDGIGVQVFPDKGEGVWNDVVTALKDNEDVTTRKDWDDIHLILIHFPVDEKVAQALASDAIGFQQVQLHNSIITMGGIAVSSDILKFKAIDIHNDIVAEADLARELGNVSTIIV